jgi:hypothetical protein
VRNTAISKRLETRTTDGWCHLTWIERSNHRRVTNPLRYQVQWQVDTGEVRLQQEQQSHGGDAGTLLG